MCVGWSAECVHVWGMGREVHGHRLCLHVLGRGGKGTECVRGGGGGRGHRVCMWAVRLERPPGHCSYTVLLPAYLRRYCQPTCYCQPTYGATASLPTVLLPAYLRRYCQPTYGATASLPTALLPAYLRCYCQPTYGATASLPKVLLPAYLRCYCQPTYGATASLPTVLLPAYLRCYC